MLNLGFLLDGHGLWVVTVQQNSLAYLAMAALRHLDFLRALAFFAAMANLKTILVWVRTLPLSCRSRRRGSCGRASGRTARIDSMSLIQAFLVALVKAES